MRKRLFDLSALGLVFLGLVVLGLTGCPGENGGGGGEGEGGTEGGTEGEGGTEETAGPRTGAVPPGGDAGGAAGATATIQGKVTLSGKAPNMFFLKFGEPACKMHWDDEGTKPRAERVVVGPQGGLRYGVVYVSGGLKNKPKPSSPTVTLRQKGCVYSPHAFGIQLGQTLLVHNDDPVLHNINAQPKKNKKFNTAQPKGRPPIKYKFRQPEIGVKIKCDVHTWMDAYASVFDHPYFATTKANGSFTLPKLPPGTYKIKVWHELYRDSEEKEVIVGDGESKDVNFEYKAK